MSVQGDLLYNLVRRGYEHDCRKHDLDPRGPEAFATDKINAMTNNEFLEALSWALDELFCHVLDGGDGLTFGRYVQSGEPK